MNDWWDYLAHSNGPWEHHKYVKIIDGVYYYPKSYKGGKYHLPESKKGTLDSGKYEDEKKRRSTGGDDDDKSLNSSESSDGDNVVWISDKKHKLTEEELEQLANDVIRGEYANAADRKKKLGKYYDVVQNLVNEKLGSSKRHKAKNNVVEKSSKKSTSKSKGTKKLDSEELLEKLKTPVNKKKKSTKNKLVKQSDIPDNIEEVDDFLMHFGMPRRSGRYPWGSGKEPYQSTGGVGPKKSSSQIEKDIRRENNKKDQAEKKKRFADSRFRRLLSRGDLNEKIKRLEDEKRLRELTEEELTPGQRFVKQVLTDSGKRVATTLLTGGTLYAVKSFIDGEFNRKDFAAALYSGGSSGGKKSKKNKGGNNNNNS